MKKPKPTKLCPVCHRPFTWRKKWEKVWSQVVYCSKACRGRRRSYLSKRKDTNP